MCISGRTTGKKRLVQNRDLEMSPHAVTNVQQMSPSATFPGVEHSCSRLRPDTAVPPWVGYNEEETIQQQILALSAVRPDPTCASGSNWRLSCLLKLRIVIVGQKKFPAGPSCRCSVPLRHGTHVSSSCSDAGRRPAAKPHALRLGS